MKRTVLFDLDGTLLDSEPDFTHILNAMLQATGRQVSATEMRLVVSSGAGAMIAFACGIDSKHPHYSSAVANFLDRYEALLPQTRATLFSGIDEMLASLRSGGYDWGIMTNKSSRFATPLLRSFPELADALTVICADQVSKGKPDPEGLIRACGECGIDPGQAVYVGDHPRDIEAARNAGMPGIAVSWGYLPSSPPITDWHADCIVTHPSQLISALQTLD